MASVYIRVLIVDDHTIVRRGLAIFLRVFDDLEIVGEASSGAEAIQLCGERKPDVVLMDMVMPEMHGIQATRAIKERYPRIQIIGLTSFYDDALVQGVLRAGAISFLLKSVQADELADAIRAAYIGRSTLDTQATHALIQTITAPQPTVGHDLSAREREVLVLMAKGFSNTKIATRLVVSPSTIKTHVSSILAKFNVASRTEAVAIAVQQHLL